ncbi:MAG: LamG domain-containing protein [Phycisphaerae bacterium]|nr:LamG domain-containing protein [Phycisphaerae bacterium]
MGRRSVCLVLVVGLCCIVSPTGYAATLVGHWAFEGNGQDASDNHNNAAATGDVSYTAGMYDQAAEFDGSGDYFQIVNNAGIQLLGTKEFSVAVYVNANALGVQGILVHGLGCSTWASWFLGIQGCEPDATLYTDQFVFGIRTGSFSAYTAVKAQAVAGEWVHIGVTHDGTTMTMYVNGEWQDSTAAALPFNSLENLYIGGDPGCSGRSWYAGLVDELYIFNRAMSESQVREVATGVLPTWLKASKPNPADGAVGVATPLLQWTKGDTATRHDVYLGTDPNLTEANRVGNRLTTTFYYHAAGLTPGATYYWRVDEIDKDGVTIYPGDVWSFVMQDVTAYYPNPADGARDVSPTPTLTWMTGIGAIKHHVYFAADADAVAAGAAETDQGDFELAVTAFAPGTLESLTTYFWRVDETVAGGVKAGPVWSFTTYLSIDDFESYTDEEGGTIYQTWVDGLTSGENGSTVGYLEAPFAEQTIVYDANQSMPLDYNNVDSPFYSEAEREFDSAQDWTAGDAGALVLYVRGKMKNDPEPLYVVIEDQSKKTGTVVHPDPKITTRMKWVEWAIPFSEFTEAGVNMARVKSLVIGVGDKTATEPGGKGLIFIDGIVLTKP